MGQPLIPDHRLFVGWICLSIGCIFTIYCMVKLWFDFKKKSKTTIKSNLSRDKSKVSVATTTAAANSNSDIKSDDKSNGSTDLPKWNSKSESSKSGQQSTNKQNQSKSKTKISQLFWCTLICYFIFNLYVLISRFYVFVIKNDKVNFPCFIWVFPQITSFMCGRMFLYLLWCDRFCAVFKKSVFQKSDRFERIMSVGIIGSMILSMSFYLIMYALYADNHCQLSGNKGHLLMAATPFTLFDLLWSAIILYLFVGHLEKLLNLTSISTGDDAEVEKRGRIYEFIKRLNILVNISILSTWLILISIYNYAPLSASAIDGIINTICIILSLKTYNTTYNKTCFICINYYESCFMKFCCCCCKLCHKINEEKKNDVTMLEVEVNK